MKYYIVTREDGNIKEVTKLTILGIQEYAEKTGEDFKVLSHAPSVMTADIRPRYRMFEVSDLLMASKPHQDLFLFYFMIKAILQCAALIKKHRVDIDAF